MDYLRDSALRPVVPYRAALTGYSNGLRANAIVP
ncbi:MAG: hypothetical protein ACJASQ_003401 [Crocinitomicaceae bacterium]|jgi:hypothetical protein